jgi:hypothetical protein
MKSVGKKCATLPCVLWHYDCERSIEILAIHLLRCSLTRTESATALERARMLLLDRFAEESQHEGVM